MIGQKIKEARLEMGLSQRQLAGDDISRAYISILEKGAATPSDKVLHVIATRLGKPVDFFLGSVDEEMQEVAYALLERARHQMNSEQYDLAKGLLDRVRAATQNEQVLLDSYDLYIDILLIQEDFSTCNEFGVSVEHAFKTCEDKARVISYYMRLGKANFKNENYPLAHHHYLQAIHHSTSLKRLYEERIQCFIYLGTINVRLGKYQDAKTYYETALSEASLTSHYASIADAHLGLGRVYHLSADNVSAILHTQKAVEYYGQAGDEDYATYAKNNLIVMKNENLKEIIIELQKYLETYERQQNVMKQANILEELTTLMLQLHRFDEAKVYCLKGLRLLDQQENALLAAKFYRAAGVIHHAYDEVDYAYLMLRSSRDLFVRLASQTEVDITRQLLQFVDQENLVDRYVALIR
ncbi:MULTISPECIES: helix-turn-helix transcriptional regulator [Exiguobacterium]|uniref:Helix-turn-helix domain-containing protein n=1 Tax=Exiguobacterium acetylicum TaxID=41170 RepID=A0ABX8GEI7_EXIAC|nr:MULTISPECIES: helix-turn-helix transcriptional regulator [Exiguobacterium]QWB31814.1 helix-turn-helix domain-containing protein [Exiguobacterium acetylicum]